MAVWRSLCVCVGGGKAKHASSFYSNLPHTCSHTNTCSIFSSSRVWLVSSKRRDESKRAGASFSRPSAAWRGRDSSPAKHVWRCDEESRERLRPERSLMNVDVTSEGHLGATMHFLVLSVISCGALSCGGLKAGWREAKTFLILCEKPLAQICRSWIARVLCDSTLTDMHSYYAHMTISSLAHAGKRHTTLFQQIPFPGPPVVAPLPVLPLHHLLHHSLFSPDLYVGAVH